VSGNQSDLLFLLYKTNVRSTTTQTLTLTIKPAATYTSVVCGAVELDGALQDRLQAAAMRDINGSKQ
jgi:hypothetical protein